MPNSLRISWKASRGQRCTRKSPPWLEGFSKSASRFEKVLTLLILSEFLEQKSLVAVEEVEEAEEAVVEEGGYL